MTPHGPAAGPALDGELVLELTEGWELSRGESGETPIAATVPGTAAAAMRDADLWAPGDDLDFDADDWWFRTTFARPKGAFDEFVLELDGIATVAEVLLNGEPVLESTSLSARHALVVSELIADHNELVVHCRALA